MSGCYLHWFADRGFALDLDATSDGMGLRLANVPINADGTDELGAGVELDRLEILFKAQVDVDGEPGQLVEAQVQLEGSQLLFTAKVEDVETGEILDFKSQHAVLLPSGVPASGGPRPETATEDDLDWEDDTTLEKMIMGAPEATPTSDQTDPEAVGPGGMQALLKALFEVDKAKTEGRDPLSLPNEAPAEEAPPPVIEEPIIPPTPIPVAPPEPEDQQIGEDQAARMFLQILVEQEGLEMEEDATLDALVSGTATILASRGGPDIQAARLSEWLLEQDAVADLFLADEDLAQLLEQW